jgi:putative peptidoglycan lipid II flippase
VDADRERELRRLERDRRRRERGQSTYFDPADVRDEPQDELATAETVVIPPAGEQPPRRLAVSAAIFGGATALSRVLGLVREIVASYYFGAAGKINAFTVAFQIPNLVRALVADAALSSAFVPVFSDLLEKGERKRAWRVASSLFWLILLGLTGLSALFVLIAPWVISFFGNPGGDQDLAIGLSQVLFPIVALLGVSGIVVGILNSYDHFTVPAISPVFWNLAIIAGLVLGVPQADGEDAKLYVYAFAILIATLIQVVLPMPWLRGRDGRLQLVIDWRDPAVRRVFVLMVPVTVSLGLINVNAVIDTLFASRLIDANLAPTAIQKAFLIYMLPQGMFSVAIATVLFPSLSRFASRNDMDAFRGTVSTGLRQITFLLLPAAVVSGLLAAPIVRILFQYGAFTADQTPVVAGALAAFSVGLVFNGAILLLNRAFFSLQANWLPTWIALGNLILNVLLDLILYRVGVWGIALATALCNVAATVVLFVLLRRRLGRMDGRAIASSVSRIVVASAVAGGVAIVVWRGLDDVLGRSFAGQAVSLGAALALAIAVYLGVCKLLQVRELKTLTGVAARLRR